MLRVVVSTALTEKTRPHVLIIGGGFGGLTAAQTLARAPVDVTLVDRRNHHLFQPLLYQVAMAGLSPAEIAIPIRAVLSRQRNVRVLLGSVTDVELAEKRVHLADGSVLPYDFLIVAVGARTAYFGHDDWEKHAPGLKSVEDAIEIRRQVLLAFERAERTPVAEERRKDLTFLVIGGGPTGVEVAGALMELASKVLAKDFRNADLEETRVLLLEGGDRLLSMLDPALSASAKAQLEGLGVEVRLQTMVRNIDDAGVHLEDEVIEAGTIIWAAGVAANPLAEKLEVPLDRTGRIIVNQDCSIGEHREAFAIGDVARFETDGQVLPGVSPVAMQQARYVARLIRDQLGGKKERAPFVYVDKGSMATIGRSRAVAQSGRLRMKGLLAWFAWLLIHIWYLVGFKNRVFVLMQWVWSYVMYRRGARLITGPQDDDE